MSDNEPTTTVNHFKGDRTKFASVAVDAPIQSAPEPSFHYYPDRFAAAAKEAEERANSQAAETYQILQVLVSFHPTFDNPQQPFPTRAVKRRFLYA